MAQLRLGWTADVPEKAILAPGEAERLARLETLRLETILSIVDYAVHPIVDINSGVVYAYEGLLRNHDKLAFETIGELFDFAYEHDFLAEFETALFEKLLDKFMQLPAGVDHNLFINLDGRDIVGADDPRGALLKMARERGIEPSCLCFEIAESHKGYMRPAFKEFIQKVRSKGVRIAVDDFGRDFSGYHLMYEYEPDFVKIDRFFVQGVDTSHRKRLFVSTITHLAHVMGARVVAEGVETKGELAVCRDISCDFLQGFLVARPFTDPQRARPFYAFLSDQRADSDTDRNLLVRGEILRIPPIEVETPLETVLSRFRLYREFDYFPVINKNGEPLGIIHENSLKNYTYSRFGFSLLNNAGLDINLRQFVSKSPIADINADPEQILDIFAGVLNSMGVTIVDGSRYVGFLTNTALLKMINEKRLRQAQDQNPLSRLPGNGSVNTFISHISAHVAEPRSICYIDFDNFKPFNDHYGFHIGDRAIMLFADLMRKHLGRRGVFLGHIGGDDFFVGYIGDGFAETISEIATLKATFRRDVESLYSPEDRSRGHIRGRDRQGNEASFPLLDCSVAVLHLDAGTGMDSPEKVAEETILLKREAKASSVGLAVSRLEQREGSVLVHRVDMSNALSTMPAMSGSA